jgi:cyclopropane fatty-acyl-phospholipid synthase-like methyltransferase
MNLPSTGYLDALYANSADPWAMTGSFYEQRKRDLLLAALDKPRYSRAFEPGCAAGALTLRLASRCESLLAADYHPRPVAAATERVAHLNSVTVQRLLLPGEWPMEQRFDLIVLSEFGYYLKAGQWRSVCERATESLTPDGTVLACHWRHSFVERQLETTYLHAVVSSTLQAAPLISVEDSDFLLNLWSRDARSPAQREARR